MASIIIAGDMYPSRESVALLSAGDAKSVFNGLLPILQQTDFLIANLEGPLVKQLSPIQKIGPHHGFDELCLKGLRAAGFNAFNLANNHAMDHGPQGLTNTIRVCREHGVEPFGAGENIEAAGQPLIKSIKGIRFALLSYAEHEFGIASSDNPGAHPIDVIHFARTVAARRQEWDALIVLLHAGNEYYPYPRPRLRELARFMIEQGASAVIFQHSHCAGCAERYRNGHIIYGQGNFLFDTGGANECEFTGVLVQLDIQSGQPTRVDLIPFQQSKSHRGPERMTNEEEKAFLEAFQFRSQAILEPGFIEKEWVRFCESTSYNYLALVQGYGQRLRELDHKFHFLRRFYSKPKLRMLLHLLRCESHHEATMCALSNALK